MDTTRRLVWATIIILGIWVLSYYISELSSNNPLPTPITASSPSVGQSQNNTNTPDLADIAYNVEGVQFTMQNGIATATNAGELQLYQATYGDLKGNGEKDAAVTLINNSDGSGVFNYVAAVFANGSATPAVFLGDRIETESITIHDGVIIVNYKDRGANQPFSTAPSIQKVAEYIVVNGQLQEKTITAK